MIVLALAMLTIRLYDASSERVYHLPAAARGDVHIISLAVISVTPPSVSPSGDNIDREHSQEQTAVATLMKMHRQLHNDTPAKERIVCTPLHRHSRLPPSLVTTAGGLFIFNRRVIIQRRWITQRDFDRKSAWSLQNNNGMNNQRGTQCGLAALPYIRQKELFAYVGFARVAQW